MAGSYSFFGRAVNGCFLLTNMLNDNKILSIKDNKGE